MKPLQTRKIIAIQRPLYGCLVWLFLSVFVGFTYGVI